MVRNDWADSEGKAIAGEEVYGVSCTHSRQNLTESDICVELEFEAEAVCFCYCRVNDTPAAISAYHQGHRDLAVGGFIQSRPPSVFSWVTVPTCPEILHSHHELPTERVCSRLYTYINPNASWPCFTEA